METDRISESGQFLVSFPVIFAGVAAEHAGADCPACASEAARRLAQILAREASLPVRGAVVGASARRGSGT